ncbi:hypothetical protein [Dietzia sp. ANT_WB102]|uniref:DUF7144 family membrane protein n=1 Tax=Dietzia sp. ANT_WB102 TaxID=2597345 RepID=UPI0011EBE41D|nr:hypothetical protein [Dietzia sp. ANT_WB102]KAA0917998.1 hypothetical protein FQ137_00910 [Dietzia sp. ANT_WB102]
MATTAEHRTDVDQEVRFSGGAGAATLAAAILLLVSGAALILQGIAALLKDDLFIVGVQYIYSFSLTGWGWVHVIVGILVVLSALGLFSGATWARVVAIGIAGVSIIANFLWLPYFPWWAILIIALDIVVIWALATWEPRPTTNHGRR